MANQDELYLSAEEAAGLVWQQGKPEQRGEIARAEQLADDRRGRRHRRQPGETQAGGEQVEGPFGGRHQQVPGDQQRARAIHQRQHMLAAVTPHPGAGEQAAEHVGQPDDGQRGAGHPGRKAAQVDLAGQMRDQEGDVKAAGEKTQVKQQIAGVVQSIWHRFFFKAKSCL